MSHFLLLVAEKIASSACPTKRLCITIVIFPLLVFSILLYYNSSMSLSQIVPIRLTPEVHEVLLATCVRYRVSRSEFIRHALSQYTLYLAYEGESNASTITRFQRFLQISNQDFP
jgi:hypothetical protein